MLRVQELDAGYGDLGVLHGIELEVVQEQILAVVGSNGSGKTTLMRAISGLIKPKAGKIVFQDRDISGLPAHVVSELGVVYVPEGRKLFSRLSVLDNLLVGSYTKRARSLRKENLQKVFEMFPVLYERRSQRAGTLSGGEQQMLAIARGLMACPEILLLDEPSLGIAPVVVDRIFKTVEELRKLGMTIIISEQNVRRTLEIADTGVVIQSGRIVLAGTSQRLLQSDMIKRAYLGM